MTSAGRAFLSETRDLLESLSLAVEIAKARGYITGSTINREIAVRPESGPPEAA